MFYVVVVHLKIYSSWSILEMKYVSSSREFLNGMNVLKGQLTRVTSIVCILSLVYLN